MQTTIPLFLLFANAGLGLLLGIRYLRGIRNTPYVVSLHLLLGATALETLAMVLRGSADGSGPPAGTQGPLTASLVAGALFVGLLIPVFGRRSRQVTTVALAFHASLAAAGVILALTWLLHRAS
jgi:hypothetical protein